MSLIRNIAPRHPPSDLRHRGFRNTESFRQFTSSAIRPANDPDHLLIYPCVRVALTCQQWRIIVTTLGVHIRDIVKLRSQKQVIRANTWRVIAMVKDTHSLWHLAIVQRPRHTSRTQSLAAARSFLHVTISMFISVCSPEPTGISLFDLGPKTISEWGNLTGHRSSSLRCRAGGVQSAARLSDLPQLYGKNEVMEAKYPERAA